MSNEIKKVGAPENNKNAEKWTLESANDLFDKAIKLTDSEDVLHDVSIDDLSEPIKSYDFVGEVARDLKTHRDIFTYLKNTYPELNTKHSILLSNLEANCFTHGKKGDINPAMAIMNLKANYRWSDRVETTLQGGDKPVNIVSLGGGNKPG